MKVVISPNPYRDRQFRYALRAKEILDEIGVETKLCLPFEPGKGCELPKELEFTDIEQGLKDCDAFLCLGGDGTILHASRLVSERGIPILGINIGTLGFMAELDGSDMSLLRQLTTPAFCIEDRMMLEVHVRSGGKTIYSDHALNDAVVTKGAVARVLQMNVRCNGSEVLNCCGDGMILATPTGSTAYSLSAGGPIVEPTAENILITPICAHGKNFSSFVTSSSSQISVSVEKSGRRNAFLSVDGGRAFRLDTADNVLVTRSTRVTRLIRLKERSFYQTISKKFFNR